MTTSPLLTVIIVSWKVRDLLRDCLASLYRESALPPGAMEVIVVDNASGDGTAAMVRSTFPQATMIDSAENLGFGRANTMALERARAPFVLLLNPDTIVLDGGIDRMLERIQKAPDIAALGCRLCNADGSLQRWTAGRFPSLGNVAAHYLLPAGLLARLGRGSSVYLASDVTTERDVDWLTGACLLLRRESVPTPLFDPAYWMYGEDIDLCHRIRRQHGRIVYSPAVTVMHYQGASMRQQSGDALLSSLKGMRQFYALRSGPLRTRAFDAVTITGFGLRAALYWASAALKRDARLRDKARASAGNARLAIKLMRAGGV